MLFIYDGANNINGRCVEDDASNMKVNGSESYEGSCDLILVLTANKLLL